MAGNNQKQQERKYIDALIATLWPGEDIPYQPSESPDWIIFSGRKVGVEVTELPDSIFRPIEGRENKVISMALEIAVDRCLPPTQVRVGFTRTKPIPHKEVASLANALAECVETHYDPETFVSHEVPMHSPLLPHIDHVWISPASTKVGHNWRDLRANTVRELTNETIQSALDSKTTKIATYKVKCIENWLVIGAEGSYSSSTFRTASSAITAKYNSAFDRVFYINLAGIEVKELSIRPTVWE